jgi:hypothetical protein
MGLINTYESIWVVNAVELVLHRMGRLEYSGLASKVYNETYFKSALEKKEI